MSERKPYKDRNDLEKIQSQWNKLSGLHSREEWSAAIVRAATAAEIAANFAIRKEFESKSQLSPDFVDSLLIWANGIAGKIDRLLIKLTEGEKITKQSRNSNPFQNKLTKNEMQSSIRVSFATPKKQRMQFSNHATSSRHWYDSMNQALS